jgi:hypothetical protein
MKKRFYYFLLLLLFPIVFNLIFFMLGDFGSDETKTPDSVWISYGFIHLAYLGVVLAAQIKLDYNIRKVCNCISVWYFILELITGCIFIFWLAPETVTAAILWQAIEASIYIALLLLMLIGNEEKKEA